MVEALGNGVQAYKQMDVKSIVSQEANYISRGCNEMLSDLNNVINARNQLLEAAFSKWINANQKYINKMYATAVEYCMPKIAMDEAQKVSYYFICLVFY